MAQLVRVNYNLSPRQPCLSVCTSAKLLSVPSWIISKHSFRVQYLNKASRLLCGDDSLVHVRTERNRERRSWLKSRFRILLQFLLHNRVRVQRLSRNKHVRKTHRLYCGSNASTVESYMFFLYHFFIPHWFQVQWNPEANLRCGNSWNECTPSTLSSRTAPSSSRRLGPGSIASSRYACQCKKKKKMEKERTHWRQSPDV